MQPSAENDFLVSPTPTPMAPADDGTLRTRAIACTGCGATSDADRRFCGDCGGQLWDPCLKCNQRNPISEAFCGQCGADLKTTAEKLCQQFQCLLDDSERLASDGRFLDAVSKLEELPDADHSTLRPLIEEAARRVEEYPKQREEAIRLAATAIEEAQSLWDSSRVEAAFRRIANTPKAFHNAEMRAMSDKLEVLVDESRRLRASVLAAVKERDYNGLLPRVERLAELNGDAKVLQLRDQLRRRQRQQDIANGEKFTQVARKAVKSNDYARAQAAIDRIPAEARQGDVAKVVTDVRERVWLYDQLKTAPYIDSTLIKAAERLHKLQPSDERVEQIVAKIKSRWAQQLRQRPREPTPWAQPPAETELAAPVQLYPAIPQPLATQQSDLGAAYQSLTAYGLALQAAGKAKYEINLTPASKHGSWLGRIPKLRSQKGPLVCWGVDVGASALKAVQLKADGAGIEAMQIVMLRQDEIQEVDSGAKHGDYSKLVAQFLDKHDVSGCRVAINLSGAQTLGRFFELPASKPDKFASAVRFELKARIPLAEEDVVHDYAWTPIEEKDEPHGPTDVSRRRVVLAAANRESVGLRLQPWVESGASQLIIQSDCIALANALASDVDTSNSATLTEGSLILEIGAITTNFVTVAKGGLWFRGAYLGMRQFDAALATKSRITKAEAENLRKRPDRAALMHETDDQLHEEYRAFAEELRRILDQFHHETGIQPSRLLLCGGGSQHFGLLRFLRFGK